MRILIERPWFAGLLGAAVTALVMFATEPFLAIGWDEGFTLGRENRLRLWFRALADPAQFSRSWSGPGRIELVQPDGMPAPRAEQLHSRWKLLFEPDVVAWFWPFACEEPHGHPPFYALLGLAGDLIAPGLQDLPRARVGPIVLFSLTAGAIAGFFRTRLGAWSAGLATAAWLLQPNLFGHGHYAAYDGVASSLWVLGVLVFARAVVPTNSGHKPRLAGWPFVLGLILGVAAATKLTGWFLPIPFLAWTIFYRSRSALVCLAIAIPIAALIFLLLNPPWWTDPLTSLLRFLNSNLGRAKTIPIQVLFLGTIYNTPRESLPFYNTLLWTVMVTPIGFLGLAILGLAQSIRRPHAERLGMLFTGHWLFLIALRALPHTPGHDGVRLFLPAFGMLALLAGLGAHWLTSYTARWGKKIAAVSIAEGLISIAIMMPTPIAYFSPLVGGLPGATQLGMEPTYYWDALDSHALEWLRSHTHPGRTIIFRTFPLSWLYLRSTGALPRAIAPFDLGQAEWVVLQNRPGAFTEADRLLTTQGRPAYVVEKCGVPLVWIYPYGEIQRLGIRSGK